MKKIKTLFKRNYDDGSRQVLNELEDESVSWVASGEGVATRKLDGTCCMVLGGKLYKRFELKKGKAAPENFQAAQAPDAVTGDTPGWVPVGFGPEDQYHREAQMNSDTGYGGLRDGTYELMGPKIQKNPAGLKRHMLVRHDSPDLIIEGVPRTFNALREWFQNKYAAEDELEGIVFWRKHQDPNSDLVKIKARDFGIKRTES